VRIICRSGEAGLKLEEGGEDEDKEQVKGDEKQLSPSKLKSTNGELGNLTKIENEKEKESCP
jgi:hypothetical protein